METFNEFEQSGTAPQRNFSEIINHAFKIYSKTIGWSILLLVLAVIISIIFSYLSGIAVGYNALEAQSEMEDIISSGSADGGNLFLMMLQIPGYKESIGISYILGLLLYPLYAGFVYLMHKANTGTDISFGDLFIGFKHNTLQLIIFGFISGIIMGISILLCVVPVFFVIPLFYMGVPFILFENNTAIEAIKKSFNVAKENYGTVLGVSFIALVIAVAGILLCGIGVLLTAPFFYAAMYSVYCAYRGTPKMEIAKP